MRAINWGILGCGKIAHKFASDLKLVDGAVLFAAGSTDSIRAKNFSEQYGFKYAFDSYETLCKSDVDVIYVATPHGFHFEHVQLCLSHQKAVLCEKAFTLNLRQTEELIRFAREKGVFLMEAFWTKFIPQYKQVVQMIESGVIGEIKMITADFGFKSPEPKPQRLYDPVLGGGALLDIGIYPVFLAQSLLGEPESITASITPYGSGVDEQIAMTLKFSGGAMASLNASFAAETPVEAFICGTLGKIYMSPRFHNPSTSIFLELNGQPRAAIKVAQEPGFGYQYEARHVQDCLREGLKDSPVLTLEDTRKLMKTLDRIREKCGIVYRQDDFK
jgi:predicted dehydrogenase